jgi:hypothetical protein
VLLVSSYVIVELGDCTDMIGSAVEVRAAPSVFPVFAFVRYHSVMLLVLLPVRTRLNWHCTKFGCANIHTTALRFCTGSHDIYPFIIVTDIDCYYGAL